MEPLAGERIEEPGRVADQEPARARPAASLGRRAARRPRSRRTARASAPVGRVVGGRRDGRERRVADRGRPVRARVAPPRRPEHDPDVDPPAGHRREADVAVAEHDEPARPCGPSGSRGPGRATWQRQPDPWRQAGGRATPAAARHDRMRAVRADDDAGPELACRRSREAVAGSPRRPPRSTEVDRRAPADLGARPPRPATPAPDPAPTDRSPPPAGRRAPSPYVSGTTAPPGVSRRIAGIGRATSSMTGPRDPSAAAPRPRAGEREDAAGPPVPRRSPAPGPRPRRPRRARPAASVVPAGPPPTIATSTALAHASRRLAAPRTRRRTSDGRTAPSNRVSTRSPAAASSAVSSATVYARRTDSGASCRVYRFAVAKRRSSQAPSHDRRPADEVVDDDPAPRDARHLGEQERATAAARGGGRRARHARRRTRRPRRAATARRRRGASARPWSPRSAGRSDGRRGEDLRAAVDAGHASQAAAAARPARSARPGCRRRRCRRRGQSSAAVAGASASMPAATARTPPSQRFTRARSRRLPREGRRSSSGPSSSSSMPDRRSIRAGYTPTAIAP